MKLTYQTGIATLIQFLALSFLTLFSQLASSAVTCHKDSDNCISNLITSTILFLLVAIVFGCIWLLGYAAQSRRSKWLTWLLICIEGLIALVSLFSAKLSLRPHVNILGLVASLVFLLLALWTLSLAYRLLQSGGGRIAPGQRGQRRRRRPPTV